MKVFTVLKTGGIYNEAHVDRISNMISQYSSSISEIFCLTDSHSISSVTTIPLYFNLPGWWSKLELFRDDIVQENELILYLDLDTVIVNDLSFLSVYTGDFALLQDPYRKTRNIAFGSGVMLFRPSEFSFLLNTFLQDSETYMKIGGGDQIFLEKQLKNTKVDYLQHLFPQKIYSYKADLCTDNKANGGKNFTGIPENASIIYFHGTPRPWEVNYLGY